MKTKNGVIARENDWISNENNIDCIIRHIDDKTFTVIPCHANSNLGTTEKEKGANKEYPIEDLKNWMFIQQLRREK